MFAIKLTLLLLGVMLYASVSLCWLFWIAPELLMDGGSSDLLKAFAGTFAWMLVSFGLVIHIIEKARPAGFLDKTET